MSQLEIKERPPLGLIPELYWKLQRKAAIKAAMARYVAHDKDIPYEWVRELHKLEQEGKGFVD
jgi:hypothetical protein